MMQNLKLVLLSVFIGGIFLALSYDCFPSYISDLLVAFLSFEIFLQDLWKVRKNSNKKSRWFEYLKLVLYLSLSMLSFYCFIVHIFFNPTIPA